MQLFGWADLAVLIHYNLVSEVYNLEVYISGNGH